MRSKTTNILWGLLFIFIGVGIAGNALDLWDFTLFFDGWWTFLIIVPCLISLLQGGVRTVPIIGLCIGVLFFLSYQPNINFDVRALFVPIILIVIGLRIMFQSLFRKRPMINNPDINVEGKAYHKGNNAEHMAFFSSNRVHIADENFAGTSLNAMFGGLVLDLRDLNLKHDIEINATAVFGGIDIYVPRDVLVKVSSVPILGGISNKANQNVAPGAPIIYLNATCMFGGIDIK